MRERGRGRESGGVFRTSPFIHTRVVERERERERESGGESERERERERERGRECAGERVGGSLGELLLSYIRGLFN